MKNLLNEADHLEILQRLNTVTAESQRRWGTMDVSQMLVHCQRPLEQALADPKPPRVFLGRIIGPFLKDTCTTKKSSAKTV